MIYVIYVHDICYQNLPKTPDSSICHIGLCFIRVLLSGFRLIDGISYVIKCPNYYFVFAAL